MTAAARRLIVLLFSEKSRIISDDDERLNPTSQQSLATFHTGNRWETEQTFWSHFSSARQQLPMKEYLNHRRWVRKPESAHYTAAHGCRPLPRGLQHNREDFRASISWKTAIDWMPSTRSLSLKAHIYRIVKLSKSQMRLRGGKEAGKEGLLLGTSDLEARSKATGRERAWRRAMAFSPCPSINPISK